MRLKQYYVVAVGWQSERGVSSILTVDDYDVEHGSVTVRRPTDVDAGVRHLTGPDHQHADQHLRFDLLRFDLLRDDDAARRVRTDLLPVLYAHKHVTPR